MENNLKIDSKSIKESGYPSALKKISSPPDKIYFRGNLSGGGRRIAVVGTRKCSAWGEKTAFSISSNLASKNITIVSGLALGVDSFAHKGALESGGITWAVLAGGLDKIYPSQNEKLAGQILLAGGCLLSEYPPKTPCYPNQFILRNRLIAGLCEAVIIIEAPKDSGAVATAKFAIAQKKKVFVFPGRAEDKNFEGNHFLIRSGGRLVSSLSDIFDDIGIKEGEGKQKQKRLFSPEQNIILKAIKENGKPISVDKIIEITKLEPHRVLSEISLLEIEGMVEEENNQKYFLK